MSKCIWKTAHFGANCVEIGCLLLMQFYIFKMAANGGGHFEINIKTENCKTQFIFQKHANSCTFDKYDVNFMQLIILCGYFMNIVLVEGIIGKKSTFSQPHYRPICMKFAPNSSVLEILSFWLGFTVFDPFPLSW